MKKLANELKENKTGMSILFDSVIFSKSGITKKYNVDKIMFEKSSDSELENLLLRYLKMFLNEFKERD